MAEVKDGEERKRSTKDQINIRFSSLIKVILIMTSMLLILISIIVIQRERIKKYACLTESRSEMLESNDYMDPLDESEQDYDNNDEPFENENNVNAGDGNNLTEENLRIIHYSKEEKEYLTEKDSRVEYDLLYCGYPICENVGIQAIDGSKGIKNTEENREKYSQEYYSYKSDGFMRIIKKIDFAQPEIGDDRDNYFTISNLSTLAVSKNYDVMPRTIEYNFECSEELNQKIENYYEDKVLMKMYVPDMLRVDLNGDGNNLIIKATAEKVIVDWGEYAQPAMSLNYDAFDKDGNHVATLLSVISCVGMMEELDTTLESLQEIDSIICADLDGDSKMEIMIEAPYYEFGMDVYTYKYENGNIIGETDSIHYACP